MEITKSTLHCVLKLTCHRKKNTIRLVTNLRTQQLLLSRCLWPPFYAHLVFTRCHFLNGDAVSFAFHAANDVRQFARPAITGRIHSRSTATNAKNPPQTGLRIAVAQSTYPRSKLVGQSWQCNSMILLQLHFDRLPSFFHHCNVVHLGRFVREQGVQSSLFTHSVFTVNKPTERKSVPRRTNLFLQEVQLPVTFLSAGYSYYIFTNIISFALIYGFTWNPLHS